MQILLCSIIIYTNTVKASFSTENEIKKAEFDLLQEKANLEMLTNKYKKLLHDLRDVEDQKRKIDQKIQFLQCRKDHKKIWWNELEYSCRMLSAAINNQCKLQSLLTSIKQDINITESNMNKLKEKIFALQKSLEK